MSSPLKNVVANWKCIDDNPFWGGEVVVGDHVHVTWKSKTEYFELNITKAKFEEIVKITPGDDALHDSDAVQFIEWVYYDTNKFHRTTT